MQSKKGTFLRTEFASNRFNQKSKLNVKREYHLLIKIHIISHFEPAKPNTKAEYFGGISNRDTMFKIPNEMR